MSPARFLFIESGSTRMVDCWAHKPLASDQVKHPNSRSSDTAVDRAAQKDRQSDGSNTESAADEQKNHQLDKVFDGLHGSVLHGRVLGVVIGDELDDCVTCVGQALKDPTKQNEWNSEDVAHVSRLRFLALGGRVGTDQTLAHISAKLLTTVLTHRAVLQKELDLTGVQYQRGDLWHPNARSHAKNVCEPLHSSLRTLALRHLTMQRLQALTKGPSRLLDLSACKFADEALSASNASRDLRLSQLCFSQVGQELFPVHCAIIAIAIFYVNRFRDFCSRSMAET